MDERDDDLRAELESAFGGDLPGEEFDRAVLERTSDGGGEHELAIAAPRVRWWLVPAAAAAILAFVLFRASPEAPHPGAPGDEPETDVVASSEMHDVTCRVTDGKDHAIPGARLLGIYKSWADGIFRTEWIRGETGRDGNYTFEDLVPKKGRYAVHLAAFAPGYAFTDHYELKTDEPPGLFRFELVPAPPVRIRFVDDDGKPVKGVLARPAARTPAKGERKVVYAGAARPLERESGADGVIELDGFAPGDEAMIACRYPSTAWSERKFRVDGGTVEIRAGDVEDHDEPEDIARVRSEDLRAGGDENMRYFLIGPTGIEGKPPRKGFGLLLVLPGGDGGADFGAFVKRIALNSLDETWIVAQLVAPKWSTGQRVVWPTERTPEDGMEFTTEEFIEAVVKDVAKHKRVDPKRVLALGWSSSGPALYAAMLERRTPLTGAFLAMSVFKPDYLPSLSRARGRRFYLLHSPDDRTCPYRMAEAAKEQLERAGAEVKLATYPGGHGWRGDVFGQIERGLTWLLE